MTKIKFIYFAKSGSCSVVIRLEFNTRNTWKKSYWIISSLVLGSKHCSCVRRCNQTNKRKYFLSIHNSRHCSQDLLLLICFDEESIMCSVTSLICFFFIYEFIKLHLIFWFTCVQLYVIGGNEVQHIEYSVIFILCSCTVTKCKSDKSSLYLVHVLLSNNDSAHCLQCTTFSTSTLVWCGLPTVHLTFYTIYNSHHHKAPCLQSLVQQHMTILEQHEMCKTNFILWSPKA